MNLTGKYLIEKKDKTNKVVPLCKILDDDGTYIKFKIIRSLLNPNETSLVTGSIHTIDKDFMLMFFDVRDKRPSESEVIAMIV